MTATRMTPSRRWCAVGLAAILLVAAPVALRSLPAEEASASPATLVDQARAGLDRPWSGVIETEGTLQLPDADEFSGLAALLGERTRLRAWWRDGDHWRVDRLLATGETDLVREGGTTVEWSYERARATVSRDPDIRLPRTGDLLPPVLGERLLRGVADEDTTTLASRRIAGRSAAGLRVRPPSPLSSINRVDMWTDLGSGVPLLVEVYADGSATPDFTSRFTEFSPAEPDAGTVSFSPTRDTEVEFDDVLDIADAANQYAPLRPPRSAAGLARSGASDGAVGVYGEGATQLIAIPLRDREAGAVRDQMALTPGVKQDETRTVVTLGPLGLLLTGPEGDGGYLLAGTLTRDALEQAAEDVLDGVRYIGEPR